MLSLSTKRASETTAAAEENCKLIHSASAFVLVVVVVVVVVVFASAKSLEKPCLGQMPFIEELLGSTRRLVYIKFSRPTILKSKVVRATRGAKAKQSESKRTSDCWLLAAFAVQLRRVYLFSQIVQFINSPLQIRSRRSGPSEGR